MGAAPIPEPLFPAYVSWELNWREFGSLRFGDLIPSPFFLFGVTYFSTLVPVSKTMSGIPATVSGNCCLPTVAFSSLRFLITHASTLPVSTPP